MFNNIIKYFGVAVSRNANSECQYRFYSKTENDIFGISPERQSCTSFHVLLLSQARINRRRVARAYRAQPLCSDKEVGNASMFKTGEQFCHVS